MNTLQPSFHSVPYTISTRKNIATRFIDWCAGQQENRLIWLAVIICGHGCIFTPLTLLFVMLAGNSMLLWPFAMAGMAMSLVVNLAAMPTKYTIPVFVLSLLIDLALIVNGVIYMINN